jgi:hypothetical protein
MSSFTDFLPVAGIGGSGTANYIPKFIDTNTLGNGLIQDNGTTVSISGNLSVTGTILDSNGEAGTSGQILSSTGTGTDWIDASGGGGGVSGSGTTNYISKWSSSSAITDSSIYESAGNVGINMIPAKTLDLQNTDNLAIRFYNGASFKAGIEVATTAGDMVDFSAIDDLGIRSQSNVLFATGGNFERMRISSTGNVGIGTTSPAAKLQIQSTNSGVLVDTSVAYTPEIKASGILSDLAISSIGNGGNLILTADCTLASIIQFNNGGSERMRITHEGNVFIGTTTIAGKGISFIENSGVGYYVASTYISSGTVTHYQFNNPNGAVGTITTSGSATAYNTSSDYRLKENVVPMEGALDRVDALKPSRFNFIKDPSITVDGFLAHQVQEVVPEAIVGEKDAVDKDGNPVYQGIDQSKLVPLLVGAIQELRAEIELLKNK